MLKEAAENEATIVGITTVEINIIIVPMIVVIDTTTIFLDVVSHHVNKIVYCIVLYYFFV